MTSELIFISGEKREGATERERVGMLYRFLVFATPSV